MKAYAKHEVGEDVAKSMKFFQHVFGPPSVERFYATEIPYNHGEAFPGMIHLALSTFVESDKKGFDEWFRAHEVGHQWWGISVDFKTYRDQWLSEGFASFAGLWYLQTNRGEAKQYFDMLLLINMRLVAFGETEDVFTLELLQKTYGGRLTILSEVAQEVKNLR